jgi:uncharacterized protein (DUF2235 family)
MARAVILLSDGTGNSAAKLAKTNVWRTYQAIDLSGPDQIAEYDDGVGTSSIKLLALLGGAFGWGLKRNVLHLYKFLCRNYRDGDRIFGFGFSRGAFTIRVLTGLVLSQGLVRWHSEEELDLLARAAYREFREKRFRRKFSLAWVGRLVLSVIVAVRNSATGRKPYDSGRNRQVPSIAFLGLWDTVDAYGMPIEELKIGIDKFIWPLYFDSLKLDKRVERAYHALALDDARATFHPLVWDESAEPLDVTPKRVNQVWFAGMHSNVGGGYPDDALSRVSLLWVLDNARGAKLRMKSDVVDEYRLAATPYGRMYDSRSGLGSYYRYAPRKVESYRNPAVIHESVYLRMSNGDDQYAPISLPAPETCENEYELAWDTVWWRSIAYWLMLGLTVAVAILGWTTLPWPALDEYAYFVVKLLVGAAKALAPAILGRWLDNFIDSPTAVLVLLGAIVGTSAWGRFLEGRIRDRASAIWRSTPTENRREWFKQSRQRWRAGTRLLVALTIAAFVWALWRLDTVWGIGTFIGMLAAATLLVVRARYDSRRETRLKDPATSETPAWGLRFARALRRSHVLVVLWDFVANKVIPFVFAMALLAAGAYVINRIGFEVLNVGGLVCRANTDAKKLGIDQERIVSFRTSDPCLATNVVMEQGATYEIEFRRLDGWMDAGIPVPTTDGFSSGAPAAPWYLFLAAPMKRDMGQNWFGPIAHVGEHVQTEHILGPKTRFVVENRSGELFLFVNDAIIGVPGIWDYFYRNNRGEASIVIRKIRAAPQPKS